MEGQRSFSRQLSSREICDENYPKFFMDNLAKSFEKTPEIYSDVSLIIDGEKIRSHRIILSSFSDYFRGLFNMEDSTEIPLQNVDINTFKLLLSFAYTGRISLSTENVQDVLVAANFFGCGGLVKKSVDYMIEYMDETNVLDLLELADNLGLFELKEKTTPFAIENLGAILDDENLRKRLLSLSPPCFMSLLETDDLILRSKGSFLLASPIERERVVLDLIADYHEVDSAKRGPDLKRLLRNCVKWSVLTCSSEFKLELAMNSNRKFREICENLLENAIHFLSSLRKGVRPNLSRILKYPKLSVINSSIEILKCNECELFRGTEEDGILFDLLGSKGEIGVLCFRCIRVLSLKEDKSENGLDVFPFMLTLRKKSYGSDLESLPVASNNEAGRSSSSFLMVANEHEYITKLQIETRLWDGREVIRSLGVTFSSGRQERNGGQGDIYDSKEVDLEPGEHIVEVMLSAGWMVDRIGFTTKRFFGTNERNGRVFGPFGGDGGSEKPSLPHGYTNEKQCFSRFLVGFRGSVTHTFDQGGITHMRVVWRTMVDDRCDWIYNGGKFLSTVKPPRRAQNARRAPVPTTRT